MSRYVIGVDPGKTTGVFILGMIGWTAWAYEYRDELGDELERFLAEWRGQVAGIWCEKFTIGPGTLRTGTEDAYWSIEATGVVKHLGRRYGVPVDNRQKPADAKKLFPDPVLKRFGWHSPGRGHANDAARQVGLGLASAKLLPEHMIDLLAPQ